MTSFWVQDMGPILKHGWEVPHRLAPRGFSALDVSHVYQVSHVSNGIQGLFKRMQILKCLDGLKSCKTREFCCRKGNISNHGEESKFNTLCHSLVTNYIACRQHVTQYPRLHIVIFIFNQANTTSKHVTSNVWPNDSLCLFNVILCFISQTVTATPSKKVKNVAM